MTDFFKIETQGEIETVVFDRPERLNAIDLEGARALNAYFRELRHRSDVRVIILRGAGRGFCAGIDLTGDTLQPVGPGWIDRQVDLQETYAGIVQAMRACPQPVVGLLSGPVAGAGFSLALACDVRIATPDVRMNAAYIRIGLSGCDMGSGYLLPRLVGMSLASELLLTGNPVGAERALAVGLVSRVVPVEKLIEAGHAIAGDMLKASPIGLRMTKELLNQLVDAPGIEQALVAENRQQVLLCATDEHQQAYRAFRDRRIAKA